MCYCSTITSVWCGLLDGSRPHDVEDMNQLFCLPTYYLHVAGPINIVLSHVAIILLYAWTQECNGTLIMALQQRRRSVCECEHESRNLGATIGRPAAVAAQCSGFDSTSCYNKLETLGDRRTTMPIAAAARIRCGGRLHNCPGIEQLHNKSDINRG